MNLFRSIKWRILLWQSLFMALVIVSAGYIRFENRDRDFNKARNQGFQRHSNVAFGYLLPVKKEIEPFIKLNKRNQSILNRLKGTGPTNAADIHYGHVFYILWDRDKNVIERSETAPNWVKYPKLFNESGKPEHSYSERHDTDDYALFTDFDDDGYAATVGFSNELYDAKVRKEIAKISVTGLIGLLAFIAISYLIIRREHRPIREISKIAEEIGSSEEHQEINLGKISVELQSLVNSLNQSYRQLNDALSQQKRLTNDVAHELRTPIAVLNLAQERLSKHIPNDEKIVVDMQNFQLSHMEEMIEKMLFLSKLEKGEYAYTAECIELQNEVQLISNAVQIAKTNEDVSLNIQCPEIHVQIHRASLAQILTNLISNAFRHATKSVNLKVDHQNETLIISVADDGPGIPPKFHKDIFKRFYRLDASRSLEKGGSGLGLAIVDELCHQLGGKVIVRNVKTGGVIFTVTLPVKQ